MWLHLHHVVGCTKYDNKFQHTPYNNTTATTATSMASLRTELVVYILIQTEELIQQFNYAIFIPHSFPFPILDMKPQLTAYLHIVEISVDCDFKQWMQFTKYRDKDQAYQEYYVFSPFLV